MSNTESCPVCAAWRSGKAFTQTAHVFAYRDGMEIIIAPKTCVHDPRNLLMDHIIELGILQAKLLGEIVPDYSVGVEVVIRYRKDSGHYRALLLVDRLSTRRAFEEYFERFATPVAV